MKKRLKMTEMLKIPQTEHVTNEDVLRKLRTAGKSIFKIRTRQMDFL